MVITLLERPIGVKLADALTVFNSGGAEVNKSPFSQREDNEGK